MQTVYADVLIILNTYVNFALLRLTMLINRKKAGRLRIFFAALCAGIYSLVILCDEANSLILFLSKIAVSCVMLLIAFGKTGLRDFLRLFAVFFGVSFIFAGLMLALWLFAAPEGMIFNNGTVYFHFSPLTLLVFTAASYALVRLILLFARRRTPHGSIFTLTFSVGDRVIDCDALCDTGSSLTDWYSSKPVILISPCLIECIPEEEMSREAKTRFIPAQTAGGEALIKIFKPQRIHIKGVGCEISNADAYIGISNTELKNGEFKAVIPYSLIKEEIVNV